MAEPQPRTGFDMSKLSMGQKGLLVTSGLMFIDLFLPWQRVCFDFGDFGAGGCASRSGWGGIGIILGLLVIAILVWEGLQIAGVNLNLPVAPALVSAGLAAGAVLFTLLKVLVDNEAFSFGGWIGIVLGLGIAYAGWVRFTEAKTAGGPAAPPPPPPAG